MRKKVIKEIPAKEAVVVTAIAEGVSPEMAVQQAGYTMPEAAAKVFGKHLWKKNVDGNVAMMNALEEVGVSPTTIAQKLKDKLDATNTISVGKGQLLDVEDHAIQLKAADMIMKTVGGYSAKKTEHVELKFEDILIHIEGLE